LALQPFLKVALPISVRPNELAASASRLFVPIEIAIAALGQLPIS
jgi:hypothetical protein